VFSRTVATMAEAKRKEGDSAIFGRHLNHCEDLPYAIHECQEYGFGFVVAPLVHPRYKRDSIGVSDARSEPFARSDLVLSSGWWINHVVGQFSTWVDLDSPDERIRSNSEKTLKQEADWGTHLSVPALLAPTPGMRSTNYARAVNEIVKSSRLNIWIKIPLQWKHEEPDAVSTTPWDAWNRFHRLTGLSPNIHVALFIGADLPEESIIQRWIAEPVRAAFIPTSIFKTNRMGYPVLSWRHQSLVLLLHKHKIQLVLTDRPRHEEGVRPYQMYLRHLLNKLPPLTQMESFEESYRDYLQSPLQPLMDNLESQTYETFEKDPIKYGRYEEAVEVALLDTPTEKTTVLMVVGAGRGPLVKASLRAAKKVGRKVRMYAVEKNPNAVVTLRDLHRRENWGDMVTIVHTDMRVWKAPEKADILVSELLGSWGDNELSPECLDGAQKFLKEGTGISIPYQYTSFVSPISTTKLWNDVSSFQELKSMETIYVVKFHNFFEAAPSKPCFTFDHPNPEQPPNNSR